MLDIPFLKQLTEAPSVGTACGPVMSAVNQWLGAEYCSTLVRDGFCLYQKQGASPQQLQVVFVAHMDEIGGCVYAANPTNGFATRVWGNRAAVFANTPLQAFDYLAQTSAEAYAVQGEVTAEEGEDRLTLFGNQVRPFRTVFTFHEETTVQGDVLEGKALDPRVTLYAVLEAVRTLDTPEVGAMLVMAEECAMDVARKGVHYLQKNAPNLALIANADVPWINNLAEGRLDMPAIRIFEGRNFIDPETGIRVADALQKEGVEFHLSAARSGSQTLLFTPLAPTLSIALPSQGVHLPRVQMSMKGLERCIALLQAIGDGALHHAF